MTDRTMPHRTVKLVRVPDVPEWDYAPIEPAKEDSGARRTWPASDKMEFSQRSMKVNTHTVAGAILASVLCGNAQAPQNQSQSVAPAQRAAGSRLTLEGVGNLGQVTPTLYRGGQPKPVGFEGLAKMGINIVVDVRLSGKDKERKEVEKAGMQYVSMPWHCLFPKDDVFARFLALLRANPGKKVFVHCRYGDDRTGMMIAAYRMSVEGWTAEEARKEMEQFGFHRLVCPSLGPYEKSFPERVKKDPALRSSLPATK